MQNWSSILESLIAQSLALGATQADAVWFDTLNVSLSCRQGKLEGLERSENKAFGLRAFVGQSQAIVSATDFSKESLKTLAENAVSMAKNTPPDSFAGLADPALYAKNLPELDLCEEGEPSVDWLMQHAHEAEEAALSTQGITNSEGADASYSRNSTGIAIARDGKLQFLQSYAGSHSSFSVSVLAGSGTKMERDYDFTSARHREDLKSAASIGHNAARLTLAKLSPRKIPTCTVPVLFDRRISRGLLSTLASCISGSSIVRGASFLKDDFGKAIFPNNITITDDPHRLRGLASKPFDGEGVATKACNFIENGVLTSWLLDVRSANALGLITNGHASRGIASPPSPSATNLYMHAGKDSPEALMKQAGTGLLITETFGMGINHITGDYSQGASGFWFENGEIAYPVSEITIAGRLRDMFAHLIPANDLVFDYATNAPSLLIETMTVAGT